MNKLPIEIISKINLFNRSKEAEIFIKAWGVAEKLINDEYKNKDWLDEYWIIKYTRCLHFHKKMLEPEDQRLPLMFGIFKDAKKVKMADIKKVCIENNFKKKTFKSKKEAWSYLIKNLN